MTLAAGSRVGPYEVIAALGAGGMGEVYRARDTQLKRDVALKVLPAEVAADPHRLARFQREAELLAALNHPHIAQIYGLAQTEGVPALVMELVEGSTLAERIARGPVPLDEVLPIAAQLAEALEYAHEHSIIHRDLKPANIKLTPDGAVKVLDFGLAKALEAGTPTGQPAQSHTLTSPAVTRAGVILGTAAYMAPEQARGVAVDKRADIWAFGVVLFEMLTGTACFTGDTITDVLLAVVRSEPNWNALPVQTPGTIRRLLRRCLAKDRKQRVHDIADARLEIEHVRASGGAGDADASIAEQAALVAASRRFRTYAFALVALAVLALAAASVAYWLTTRPPAPGPVIHADLALPEGHALVASPTISPDGRTVAFVTAGGSERPRMYIRRLMDDFEIREIRGTEEADQPFFSPDGRSVAFFAKRQLFRVRLDGGAPVAIASAPNPRGGTWGDDGSIVFVPDPGTGLVRLAAGATEPQPLIRPDGGTNLGFVHPRFLPGARELLFSVWGKELGPARLNLATLARSSIVGGYWSNAVYAASGHIVIGGRLDQEGEILAFAYDASRGTRGVAVSVQQRVFRTLRSPTAWFDLSRTGTLVYAVADISRNMVVEVDQAGRVVRTLIGERAYYDATPALSPDGTRIAYSRLGRVRVRNVERGTDDLLTTEDGAGPAWEDRAPAWTPDGRRVVFASVRNGNWDLFARDASGGGSAEPVVQGPLNQMYPVVRRQDGTIAYVELNPATSYDIRLLPPGGNTEAALATPANEVSPAFSGDGRLMAYASDESGRPEVYVTPFTRPLNRGAIVSAEGGVCPCWSPRQNRLFFWQGTKMMAVDVRSDGTPAGSPRLLFDGGWPLGAPGGIIRPTIGNTTCFEVMPHGEHFLMVRADPETIPTQLHVIFNWLEELKAKVPLK
jgi:Tol biopolymer transport system component